MMPLGEMTGPPYVRPPVPVTHTVAPDDALIASSCPYMDG